MDTHIVELKIRIVVMADNPGIATTEVVKAFTKSLDASTSTLVKGARLQATSWQPHNLR